MSNVEYLDRVQSRFTPVGKGQPDEELMAEAREQAVRAALEQLREEGIVLNDDALAGWLACLMIMRNAAAVEHPLVAAMPPRDVLFGSIEAALDLAMAIRRQRQG